jgi:hypothetical protein
MAAEHAVPVVPSFSLDVTLSTVIDHVVSEAIRTVPEAHEPIDLPVVDTAPGSPPKKQRNEVPDER